MIDKITFRARLTTEVIADIAKNHRLMCWINSDNTQVEYKSSEYSNLTGIEVSIKDNYLKLSTSLHKYWQYRNFGKFRNDNEFTISEAKSAAAMLLSENRLNPDKTYVTYFEIGLNMNVSYDPLSFIELTNCIKTSTDKEMFNDANYRKNRQRTTEKHKDLRKYFKIYDKGWQMQEKEKEKEKSPKSCRDETIKILRIETCHRRGKVISSKFFSDKNLSRLSSRFHDDWSGLSFVKEVTGKKGCRTSEVQNADILINKGSGFLLDSIKKKIKPGLLTKNHLRTVREFIRDFDKLRSKFEIVASEQEKEYNDLLFSTFKSAIE